MLCRLELTFIYFKNKINNTFRTRSLSLVCLPPLGLNHMAAEHVNYFTTTGLIEMCIVPICTNYFMLDENIFRKCLYSHNLPI